MTFSSCNYIYIAGKWTYGLETGNYHVVYKLLGCAKESDVPALSGYHSGLDECDCPVWDGNTVALGERHFGRFFRYLHVRR